ncbi:unnamed protein product, partial [Prorocentrum cordatum]
ARKQRREELETAGYKRRKVAAPPTPPAEAQGGAPGAGWTIAKRVNMGKRRSQTHSSFGVVSANGSGGGPLAALWAAEPSKTTQTASCLCVQKTQLSGKRPKAEEQWCRQHGIAAALAAGTAREGSSEGPRGGTGVLVRASRAWRSQLTLAPGKWAPRAGARRVPGSLYLAQTVGGTTSGWPGAALDPVLVQWRAKLDMVQEVPQNIITVWISEAREEAEALNSRFAYKRRRDLCEWIRSSLAVGGKQAHSVRHGPRGWVPEKLGAQGSPSGGQKGVDAVAACWAGEVWTQKTGMDSEGGKEGGQGVWLLSGRGADHFNSRQLEHISDDLMEMLIAFGMPTKVVGTLPEETICCMIVMLAK